MIEVSAGAILYTKSSDEIKYLVIKDFHNNYGFPKGHLEENENELEAALREIKEEVGIDATIDNSFKVALEYVMPNGIGKRVVYYLASFENQLPTRQEEEVQEILLLNYEDTLQTLTFDNTKAILTKANEYLHQQIIS